MNPSGRDDSCADDSTPEMLTDLSLRIEAGEDLSTRPYQPAQAISAGDVYGMERPTTEHLADVYLEVEAAADLTVHPHPPATNGPVP